MVYSVFNADGGIYYRHSPHWADAPAIRGVGVYNGDQVQLICSAFGDPVGPLSDTAWSCVNNLSRSVGRQRYESNDPPARPHEPGRGPHSPIRQRIESIFWSCKGAPSAWPAKTRPRPNIRPVSLPAVQSFDSMPETMIDFRLLDEDVDAWRPVTVIRKDDDSYRLPDQQRHDETWAFPAGSRIRCEQRTISGTTQLVASSCVDGNRVSSS